MGKPRDAAEARAMLRALSGREHEVCTAFTLLPCGEAGAAVPSHTFLAVRQSDGRLVGIIDLRHHIDHPILGSWGGHCGYSVRPSERGRGYAKEMLRLNILEAGKLGIDRLLVTCNADNPASERTILANGGVYESSLGVDGHTVRRYWITVD